jgi:ribonuclease HI
MIVWKPPTLPYIKVNTYGSLRNANAACGGIFRDRSGALMGGFSANLGDCSIFEAEIMGFIIAIKMTARHHWGFIWIEGDSTSALFTFIKPSLVPIRWRNQWHNCFSHGMQVLSSHIFREGNGCANKLVCHGCSPLIFVFRNFCFLLRLLVWSPLL